MASEVDATVPADNVVVDKADIRENFRVIKEEITNLQTSTNLARQIAFDLVDV